MPFYDLHCDACGREFNAQASMKERSENAIACPSCGEKKLSAVFKSLNVISSRKDPAPACPNSSRCGGCCGGH